MAGKRKYRGVLAVALAILVLWLLAHGGHSPTRVADGAAPSPQATTSPSVSPSATAQPSDYDPARFAAPVRTYADRAGVTPRLLMAVLYNESYKPHDPALERAWQQLKPDSAFGIANMHRAAFDETKQGRDFAARSWEELPDDPNLALDAAAWYLHDLGAQLPAHSAGSYTRDELLALGYNTGPGNMLAFARGATPGAAARSYLEQFRANLPKADEALVRS